MSGAKSNSTNRSKVPEGTCQALNLSDEKPCQEKATSLNGLFCHFHSKQCQGLYKGYKTRNARLDALDKSPPNFLVTTIIALANQTFSDVDSEIELQELHDHLSLKHALLDRVIRARKLHHSRFFSLELDYGHQHYLDALQSEKFIVLRALERLERRTADVLYKQKKWFHWVRQCQDEEEAQRDKESKMIKREAALFKRHWKEIETRMKALREKESIQLQEEFLETAYKTRISESEEGEEFDWDPVEDTVETERGNFIELIRHFLWQEPSTVDLNGHTDSKQGENMVKPDSTRSDKESKAITPTGTIETPKDRKTSKRKAAAQASSDPKGPEKGASETKLQMRQRLQQGSNFMYDHQGVKVYVGGTIENPVEQAKTASLPMKEIDQLLEEIIEIKQLLFCRLLLSHATLLPAALRAKSIEDFLNDTEISLADLRDLCLKMEQPGLEEIRDACADLMRSGEEVEESDSDQDNEDTVATRKKKTKKFQFRKGRDALPESWMSKHEKRLRKKHKTPENLREETMGGGEVIDFGSISDGKFVKKKIRVEICGKLIYNYPSEKAMTRGGWLHFCIIAKDSNLYDAIHLCRNWDEFFELNALAIFQYFPAANWVSWVGDRMRQQLLQLGLIPYFQFSDAFEVGIHHQTARNEGRRMHAVYEARNVICANIKRDDAISRRFIQYLAMQTNAVCLLVRDAKTSRILIEPPRDQQWLRREKLGLGRAVKKDWTVVQKIGEEFWKEVDSQRKWHFGFTDYYDIYVWDFEPGQPFGRLHSIVQEMLVKANRFRAGADFYNPVSPIIKTLTRDRESWRVREIKSGEDVPSIYDDVHHEMSTFVFQPVGHKGVKELPKNLFYNEADMLEDSILFPDEQDDPLKTTVTNSLTRWEHGPPGLHRFIDDLDTDEESDMDSSEDDQSIEGEGHCEKDFSEEDVDEDASEDEFDDGDSTDDEHIFPHNEGEEPEDRQILRIVEDWIRQDPLEEPDMEDEFQEFLDRERSRMFKDAWHKADLEPGAQEKYIEATDMIQKMAEHGRTSARNLAELQLLVWLDEHPTNHRHVIRDMQRAFAMIGLFYPTDFYESDTGTEFKDSFLLQQGERSECIPDRRTHSSVKCRPKTFWKDWDETQSKPGDIHEQFPMEWDLTIRPIIAHLFKEGIICNAYLPGANGQAIAATEPPRLPDLFIDYRDITHLSMPSHLKDPRIENSSLRSSARLFAQSNPSARFALLRLWSAPHFYPLMIGWDKRQEMSFFDGVGRSWAWKFIPKDMPCSEWSIHQAARLRLQEYAPLCAKNVVQKRDLFLIMGRDEEELRKLATGVTFALQTRPWRLEVDLWRSFVNVELGFLEGLDDRWLD